MEIFDYVIAGGGTAAGVLAYRLAAAGNSVCVLEAGRPDDSIWNRIPAGFTRMLRDPTFSWQLQYEACEGTNGRVTPLVQGRTLGGSSAVNGAVYSRGQALDFDTWEAQGNPGWGYRDVLPHFRRSEHFFDQGDDRFRGRSGPVRVATTRWRDRSCDAFMAGTAAAGIPATADYNGERQEGIGYCQSAIQGRWRWSTAHGYLHPARKQFGVDVRTHATVSRIIVKDGRATGVAYHRGDSPQAREVAARREVLVCAGAVHSPKLLQLSGIGPSDLLNAHGIPVVRALPGVGENLRDHYCPRIVARARPGVDSMNTRVRGLPLVREVAAWAMNRPSILSISPIVVYGFWKTQPHLPSPDFVLAFTPASYSLGRVGDVDTEPGLTCGAWQQRPQSQGHVHIRSGNFRETPTIQPNFLDHAEDRRTVVDALKWARKVFATEPMRRLIQAEHLPGEQVRSDDEMLDYARRYGSTGYHLVGTCKMGPSSDPMAVVDAQLRVHGIAGLRVVDSSIMPTIPSANTCAATVMLAEKASDLILQPA